MGTVISATRDATFDGATTFSASVLMGRRDEPLLPLCARRIIDAASVKGFTKPLIVCLGLKQHSPAVLKEIEKAVAENNAWV